MVGGVHMCCEVDDESFSWAVSILASGYLAVPLLFIFVTFIITLILVYHICSNQLLTKKNYFLKDFFLFFAKNKQNDSQELGKAE